METTSVLIAILLGAVAGVLLVRVALRRAVLTGVHLGGSWLRRTEVQRGHALQGSRRAGGLVARFDPSRFTGLPLTVVCVVGLCVFAAFLGLVDDVRETAGIVRLDKSVNDAFTPFRVAWLLKGFLWITAIGAGPCLAAMAGVATALLWSGGRWNVVPPLWLTFLGAQATTWSSKYIIDRPRPVFLPAVTEWNPSFPSGHATAVTALVGFLGYAVARGRSGSRERFEIAFWTATIIALICFSRIFLSLHFLSDVLAGLLVGSFWLLVGVTVAELMRRPSAGTTPSG